MFCDILIARTLIRLNYITDKVIVSSNTSEAIAWSLFTGRIRGDRLRFITYYDGEEVLIWLGRARAAGVGYLRKSVMRDAKNVRKRTLLARNAK